MYEIDQIYEFKVKKKFSSQTELIDESTGVTTYLHDTAKLNLFKGQFVRCRVTALGLNRPVVELVDLEGFDYLSGLSKEELDSLLSARSIKWNTEGFVSLLLTDEHDETFEEQSHRWIKDLNEENIDLKTVRTDCSNLLELSGLLDRCGAQREFYQERLTKLIELIGYYMDADKLISENRPETFINELLNKLKVSGFVYHPNKQFNILTSLFMRQPEMMRRRIAELLKIICGRDLSIWKKEPFNTALSKLLEFYIHEWANKIDREKDPSKTELIQNLLTALTIQLLLASDTNGADVIDPRLTTARLCIISSYLNQGAANELLDNAYRYLFCDDIKHLKPGFEAVDNIHYIIANFEPGGTVDAPSTFAGATAKLTVSSDGISLRPTASAASLIPVLPSSDLWKGMQVYLNSRPSISLASLQSKNLKLYRDIWAEIENDLFNATPHQNENNKKAKKHRIGDEVEFSVVGQNILNRNRFECRIEDEVGGEAYIMISDIVPYKVDGASWSMFLEDGARRVYPARIIDIDTDGKHHLSASEFVKDGTEGYYEENEEIVCRLGKKPHAYNGLAPAISREGLSVSVFAPAEFRNLPAGKLIKCRFIGQSAGTSHIDCELTGVFDDFDIHDFSNAEAFANLMEDFAQVCNRFAEDTEEEVEEEVIVEAEKELDEEYVRQLIMCIDRQAMLDPDYIKSFNFLAFARILCRLIGWESQSAYYKGRMDIISMLHYFDVNSDIDEEELSQLETANAQLFENNKPLQERFMQLQVVSYLGKPEHTADLYRLSTRSPLLRTLSQLVIAYNVVSQENMYRVADDIHEKIKNILNLKGFGSKLKKYADGLEGETVEFKTSYIFPPKDKPTQNQKETILQVINSFLNAKGGTLYIGVNDGGRGVGVENDLMTAPFYGDKDKYILDLTNAVKFEFGRVVSPFVKVYFDPDNADKDVLIVDVTAFPEKVPMRSGSYFYRTNSSKEGYTPEEFAKVVEGLRSKGEE